MATSSSHTTYTLESNMPGYDSLESELEAREDLAIALSPEVLPLDLCELEWEDNGPHPGCREFADPVYSPCGGEQRFLFEADDPWGGTSLRVCAFHADYYGEDPRVSLVPLV